MTTADLQALLTLITFLTFVGIVIWAWSSGRRKAFAEAASIPLNDDAPLPVQRTPDDPADPARIKEVR